MGTDLLAQFIREHDEVHEHKHACAILASDFPAEWRDLCEVLTDFRLFKSSIEVAGGSKSKVAQLIDSSLYSRGWIEKQFETRIQVDGTQIESPTHSVDCFKNRVALEIEWNNKGPIL